MILENLCNIATLRKHVAPIAPGNKLHESKHLWPLWIEARPHAAECSFDLEGRTLKGKMQTGEVIDSAKEKERARKRAWYRVNAEKERLRKRRSYNCKKLFRTIVLMGELQKVGELNKGSL